MNITSKMSCAILAASSFALAAQQPSTAAPSTQSAPATDIARPALPPPSTESAPAPPTGSPTATSQELKPASATPEPHSVGGALVSSGTPAAVDSSHYVIGPDDVLQITVWREPTLSGSFPVRPDGMISMVLLGDVPASGITPTQLSANIGDRLHKFVQDPSVTVQVMGVNSQKIYLIGEVGHVGAIPLSADMSPLKAIASAGGLSPFANTKHIYILRGSGATQQKIPFNYKQALKGDDRQQVVLHPGDTIVVP